MILKMTLSHDVTLKVTVADDTALRELASTWSSQEERKAWERKEGAMKKQIKPKISLQGVVEVLERRQRTKTKLTKKTKGAV